MLINCVGTTTGALGWYHFGPMHPGYICSASGHVILAGTTICTDSIMSLSIQVGTMGRHIGDSPYASHSVTNGIRYHMMSAMPFRPTNPMTVATRKYNMYARNRLTTTRLVRERGQRVLANGTLLQEKHTCCVYYRASRIQSHTSACLWPDFGQ
jgi:hypothetical protein